MNTQINLQSFTMRSGGGIFSNFVGEDSLYINISRSIVIIMTPKQVEKIKKKIDAIKAALAADKKQWGGDYHDGRGLRYLPPQYYIQLGDFKGGLRYFNWFNKNFPDDAGFPHFLFEWTIVLFKTGKLKEAQTKLFQTYTENTYLFDKFLGKPIVPIEKWEGSNLNKPEFATEYFSYFCKQEGLESFAGWLETTISTEPFPALCARFIEIFQRLNTEKDYDIRRALVDEANQLEKQL